MFKTCQFIGKILLSKTKSVLKLSCCSMFSISAVPNSTLFNSSANTSSKINFLTFEMLHWLLLVLLFQLAISRRRKKSANSYDGAILADNTSLAHNSKIKAYYLGLIGKDFSSN